MIVVRACSRRIRSSEWEVTLKITKATTYIVGNPWKNWLFVRLDTDQPGVYGVGEGSLNGFAKTIEAAIHELSHFYEGMIRSRSKRSASGCRGIPITRAARCI